MTISLHLANTMAGEHDPRWPLPKPIHCDGDNGRINRAVEGRTFDQVIGFVEDVDDTEDVLTWAEVMGEDDFYSSVEGILGWFPVISEDGEFATLALPVRAISVDGAVVATLLADEDN